MLECSKNTKRNVYFLNSIYLLFYIDLFHVHITGRTGWGLHQPLTIVVAVAWSSCFQIMGVPPTNGANCNWSHCYTFWWLRLIWFYIVATTMMVDTEGTRTCVLLHVSLPIYHYATERRQRNVIDWISCLMCMTPNSPNKFVQHCIVSGLNWMCSLVIMRKLLIVFLDSVNTVHLYSKPNFHMTANHPPQSDHKQTFLNNWNIFLCFVLFIAVCF